MTLQAQIPAGLTAVEVREKAASAGEMVSGNAGAASIGVGGEVPTVKEPPKKEQQYLRSARTLCLPVTPPHLTPPPPMSPSFCS
jgi:hypothetical protein